MDNLIIIAPNDAYVMSGWQKVNVGGTEDDNTFVIFASDLETKLANQIGWTAPGDRNGRWAAIIDHGKIIYAENETELQAVTVSGGMSHQPKADGEYLLTFSPVDAILKAL